MINLKCCEIHEIKNERIIESHILIDVMDFLRQQEDPKEHGYLRLIQME